MSVLKNYLFLASIKVAVPIKFGFWRLVNVAFLIGAFTLFCIAEFKHNI
jgi:hypothetical protein